jgi:hypothetical protein
LHWLYERKSKLADRVAKLRADNKRRTAHNDVRIAELLERSARLDVGLDAHRKENVRRIQARITAGRIPPDTLDQEMDYFGVEIFRCPKTAGLNHDLRLARLTRGEVRATPVVRRLGAEA